MHLKLTAKIIKSRQLGLPIAALVGVACGLMKFPWEFRLFSIVGSPWPISFVLGKIFTSEHRGYWLCFQGKIFGTLRGKVRTKSGITLLQFNLITQNRRIFLAKIEYEWVYIKQTGFLPNYQLWITITITKLQILPCLKPQGNHPNHMYLSISLRIFTFVNSKRRCWIEGEILSMALLPKTRSFALLDHRNT